MIATMEFATDHYPATCYFEACESYPHAVNAIKARETILLITKTFNHIIKKTFYPATRII